MLTALSAMCVVRLRSNSAMKFCSLLIILILNGKSVVHLTTGDTGSYSLQRNTECSRKNSRISERRLLTRTNWNVTLATPNGKNMSMAISQVLNFVRRPILRLKLSLRLKNRRIVFWKVTPYSLLEVYGRFRGMDVCC
jgi:hypothetical protein